MRFSQNWQLAILALIPTFAVSFFVCNILYSQIYEMPVGLRGLHFKVTDLGFLLAILAFLCCGEFLKTHIGPGEMYYIYLILTHNQVFLIQFYRFLLSNNIIL